MFGLEKRRIIRDTLRFRYRGLPGATWWLRDESLTPLCDSVVDVARDIIGKVVVPSVEMLKSSKRKAVFRMQNPGNCRETFVAKLFCLDHLSHRLNYRQYGLDEAANLIEARKAKINVPQVHGYCNVYDRFALVRASVLILEDLHDWSPISELAGPMSENARFELLMNTSALFVSLYRANCNHIDVNSRAVLVGNSGSDRDICLLDFQHARFRNKPSVDVLMFECGFFARSCREWISAEATRKWLAVILSRVGITDPAELEKAKETFEYHRWGKGLAPTRKALSRKQRKRIGS